MKTLKQLQQEIEKEFEKIWITPNEFVGSPKEPVFNLDIREKEIKQFLKEATEMVAREALGIVDNKDLNSPSVPDKVDDIPQDAWINGYFEALTESERLKGEFLSSKDLAHFAQDNFPDEAKLDERGEEALKIITI